MRQRKAYVVSVLLYITAIFLPNGLLAQEGVQPAEDHGLDYKIVLQEKASAVEVSAAETLAKYLGEATGGTFPITRKMEPRAIVIGVAGQVPLLRENLDVEKLRKADADSFQIKTSGQRVMIGGNTPEAVLYGVHYFLERYVGIQWFSADFVHVPKRSALQFPAIDDLQIPRFGYREVFIREADDPDYATGNLLNGRLGHRADRTAPGSSRVIRLLSLRELAPPKRYRKAHPEFYCGGQLDFMNRKLRELLIANLKKRLAALPSDGSGYVVLQNADRSSYCRSSGSRAMEEKYGAPSAAYIDFVAEAARGIREEFPDTVLLASAYKWSRKPPGNMELPENMGIMLCDIELDFSRPVTYGSNRLFLKDLEGWAQISDRIIIWHYITNFSNYLMPYPDLQALGEDLGVFARFPQVRGVFLEGAYGTLGSEFAELRVWVLAKLLWNPERNMTELIREFCEGYYGAAAPYILDYITQLHDAMRRSGKPLRFKMPSNSVYLSGEFLLRAEQLFAGALDAVKNDPVLTGHVKRAKLSIDMAILVAWPDLDTKSRSVLEKNGGNYAARYRDFSETVKHAQISRFSENGRIDELLTVLSAAPESVLPPPEAANLVKNDSWFDFQELAMELCCTRLVLDPDASDGVAAVMKGNSTQWGFQLNLASLPLQGRWKIYASVKVEADSEAALLKRLQFAFFYGVYGHQLKSGKLFWDFRDGRYHTIEIGTFAHGEGYAWIRPPANEAVELVYVDRFFIVREEPER